MLSGKHRNFVMATPKLEQNGIVWSRQIDGKTKKVIYKRLRRIYTDAVTPDGSIPDNGAFEEVVQEAAKHAANDAVDGYDVRPWEERLMSIGRVIPDA
jgi:hypothetical protein